MTRAPDEIGAHMSIAGGLFLALERGRELGCGAVQIFLKNQRQWAAKPLAADEVRQFRAARRAHTIRHVFAHSSYLINLGNPNAALWSQAVDAFTDELERAEALGLSCVVIHPGSHMGVCLDTCHLFAAGYDLRTPAGYRRAMAEREATVGRRRVLAFHLNDAKAPLGSGLDRHENIGRGLLGLTPFRLLLNDRRFARVPKVLETPKEPEPTADLRNLAVLRRLRLRRRLGR